MFQSEDKPVSFPHPVIIIQILPVDIYFLGQVEDERSSGGSVLLTPTQFTLYNIGTSRSFCSDVHSGYGFIINCQDGSGF